MLFWRLDRIIEHFERSKDPFPELVPLKILSVVEEKSGEKATHRWDESEKKLIEKEVNMTWILDFTHSYVCAIEIFCVDNQSQIISLRKDVAIHHETMIVNSSYESLHESRPCQQLHLPVINVS